MRRGIFQEIADTKRRTIITLIVFSLSVYAPPIEIQAILRKGKRFSE